MDSSTTRVDMHCHSSASEVSRLGVQRALGLPECATAPEEVYELAKRRDMDFVTITDHDTIDGVLAICERPDVFISEELTAHFRGEPQAVHVLCYGITAAEHDWLQANKGDVEVCAAYLHENEIACALAHPWYAVGAPLSARHRRRLAQLFGVWETRNGARSRDLNRPAAMYAATRYGTGIGGSDDHAGIDIGRTWTETPRSSSPEEFLAHVRAGRVTARGAQGSAAKWAHSAITLVARSLGSGADAPRQAPDPRRVMALVQRLLREADARQGVDGGDLDHSDARSLLRAWLAAVGLDQLDERALIEHMQEQDFSHADLYRRSCRAHERKLRSAVEEAVRAVSEPERAQSAALRLFESCIAAIPYGPAAAFLARETAKLDEHREECEPQRVAVFADGIGATHGVSRTLEEIRVRGVPGFEIEIIGTDPDVDRRLSAVAELDVPFYPGLRIGVPSLAAAVQSVTDGAFDIIHVCSPGPVGATGALLARALGLPLVGSYHTDLTAYARLRSHSEELTSMMDMGLAALYGACEVVLSPSPSADRSLAGHGVGAERVLRWDRGVDTARFDPALRDRSLLGAEHINVLYSGRITHEKGVQLLADAFLAAHARDRRLHLTVAGGGPEQELLRSRLGERVSFLGWLRAEQLARAYASADIFLFPSATDTFGQVILEAQASGLPVLAVAAGGPLSLIEDGVSGLLREADAQSLAEALLELAASPLLRARLAKAGLTAVRERTWESALERLARGYERALAPFSDTARRVA
jgi:glycosyltransferase involved in cell wall biosynthesis/predicted metal-dependent phosphoesterase TrpH